MAGPDGYSLVMTTTDSDEEAESLARSLVDGRLAACVQHTRIVSHYVWEGAPTRSDEILLLIKTRSSSVAAVTAHVETHHSYETPEVIVVPIVSGSTAYLRWIDEAVG